MIVVASDNPVVVEEISTLLKQKGDLFTVAADETFALSAIRADRASLLIVDTGASAFNGFAFCREIRNDAEFAHLPVLCLIEPDDMNALLSVLDSSADGFLSRPFDLGSLSAAIGDVQDRQAAGPAPGSVRTQFRINHLGKDYTVTADRRQLLEYLLAAFETAIRVRNDRDKVESDLNNEIREISERLGALIAERDATVHNLHEEIEERGRAISHLNAAIAAKEQAEDLLKTQKENVAQELKELGAELGNVQKSDEEKSARIAELAADLAAASEEKARAGQDYAEEAAGLNARLQDLTSDLGAARSTIARLESGTEELERAVASRDSEIGESREKIGVLENELGQASEALAESHRVCDQLKESAGKARAAAQAKELEVRSALDNLNTGLRSLEAALEQNLRQLERELAARRELEQQVESLTRERDTLARSGHDTGKNLAEVNAVLAAEREARVRNQTECDAVAAERERIEEVLDSTFRKLAAVKEENETMRSELADSRVGGDEMAALKRQHDRLAAELDAARAAVAKEQEKRNLAEANYAELLKSGESSKKFLDSAARDIGVLNAALAEERERRKSAEEYKDAAEKISSEKDREIFALRQELDAVRSAAMEKGPIIIGPLEPDPPSDTARTEMQKPADVPKDFVSSGTPEGPTPGPGAGQMPGPEAVPPVSPSYQMTLPATGPAIPLPGPEATGDSPVFGPDAGVTEDQEPAADTHDEMPVPPAKDDGTVAPSPGKLAPGDLVISRDRWMDMTKWVHHTTTVTEEQRKDLIAHLMRLSKLVQKGRHLTNRQEQEIRALMACVQSLGYRFV